LKNPDHRIEIGLCSNEYGSDPDDSSADPLLPVEQCLNGSLSVLLDRLLADRCFDTDPV